MRSADELNLNSSRCQIDVPSPRMIDLETQEIDRVQFFERIAEERTVAFDRKRMSCDLNARELSISDTRKDCCEGNPCRAATVTSVGETPA